MSANESGFGFYARLGFCQLIIVLVAHTEELLSFRRRQFTCFPRLRTGLWIIVQSLVERSTLASKHGTGDNEIQKPRTREKDLPIEISKCQKFLLEHQTLNEIWIPLVSPYSKPANAIRIWISENKKETLVEIELTMDPCSTMDRILHLSTQKWDHV